METNVLIVYGCSNLQYTSNIERSHTKILLNSPLAHTCYILRQAYSSLSYQPNDIWLGVQIVQFEQ